MAGNNFVAQIGTDGLGVSERLAVLSVEPQVSYSGQAVAGGFASTRALLEAWFNRIEECSLMMESRAANIGLACRYDNDSDFGQYWTMVLSGD